MKERQIKTVRGLLVPVEWDQNGQITAIGLSMSNENELKIAPSEKIAELMPLLRKTVILKGTINQSYISVVEYQQI